MPQRSGSALRVYSWQTFVRHGGELSAGGQVWAVVAARSQAECARLAGVKRPSQLFNLGETGHQESVRLAHAHPGQILVMPIHASSGPFRILRDGARWEELDEVTS